MKLLFLYDVRHIVSIVRISSTFRNIVDRFPTLQYPPHAFLHKRNVFWPDAICLTSSAPGPFHGHEISNISFLIQDP